MERRRLSLAVALIASPLALLLIATELSFESPIAAGGAYLFWADLIADNGFRLPETFPFFGSEPDALAYPPLAIYLLAVLERAGLPLVDSLVWLPFLFYGMAAVAIATLYFTLVGRRLAVAAVGTFVFLVEPSSLVFNVDAGGVVRSLGLMWAVTAVWAGYGLFAASASERPRSRWVVMSGVAFGLSVLTHLEEAYFAGVSLVFLYAWHDRSLRGLLAGLGVLLVGMMVASPWLVHLLRTDGFTAIMSASGTHGGLFHLEGVVSSILRPPASTLISLTGPLIAVVVVVNVLSWRWFFPVWMLLLSVTSRGEHAILVAMPMLAIFLVEDLPALVDSARVPERLRSAPPRWFGHIWGGEPLSVRAAGAVALVGSLLMYQFLVALLFIVPDPTDRSDEQFRPYITPAVVAAMEWAGQQTPDDSRHAVYGDAGEWFPYFARRTNLTVARGTEWSGDEIESETYNYRTEQLVPRLADCLTVRCILDTTEELVGRPDYLDLVKQGYVGSTPDGWWAAIQLEVDTEFANAVVYRNAEVVVLDISMLERRR